MEAATSIYHGSNQERDEYSELSCSIHQISISSAPPRFVVHAQQFMLFRMSEPRCNGINGSSDIDLPWFQSTIRSILAILMLKSPDYEAHFQLLHCVRSTQFYRINLQFDWIDFSFCNFTKSTFSSCNLLD